MRRLRFDPPTLLATILAGLLPSVLLVAISLIYLNSISAPLEDLFEEPHRRRLRERRDELNRRVRARILALRAEVGFFLSGEATDLPGGDAPDPHLGRDLALIETLTWYPDSPRSQVQYGGEAVSSRGQAEALLGAIDFAEKDGQQRALNALASLPVELEDPVGFSYALEARLLVEPAMTSPEEAAMVLRQSARIDRASLAAWLTSRGNEIRLPGLPAAISVRPDGVAPVADDGISPAEESPGSILVGVPACRGSAVLEVVVAPLLLEVMEVLARTRPPGEGTFFRLVERGAPTPEGHRDERVIASIALLPPCEDRFRLVTGTSDAEPLPLAWVRRIRGIHYLWGGVVVLVAGTVASLLLAGLVSRRVGLSHQKDDFLRLVSHELRTPIASIRMMAETLGLDRVRSEEERQEFLRLLQTESERLGDLVDRVLEYGRAEGKPAVREVVTNPGELVEQAVASFREQNPDGGELLLRTAQEFHPVLLDRLAVTGVVLNLLSNARKYSPPGTPIEVTVGEESRKLFIEVRDEGIGIRRRDLRRIFRPFERGSEGNRAPGFGLGLAYCREIAEAHRGRVSVTSTFKQGSVFTLEIPLVPAGEKGTGSD